MTDAADLLDAAWRRGLAPEPQITVSEWADRHRLLPQTNAEPGRWRTDRVPYLRQIMDDLSTASPVERVVLMKGAQTGGTEAGLNAIGYWIAHAPGMILAVWPSIDMVRRNSRTRIEPLIDGTPILREKIAPARAKDPGNTVSLKEFPGGALVMTGANSATGLRSLPARYLVLDEVDAFPADAGGEGDPVALAVQRTVTFRGRRKIFMISTPTEAGVSRIEKAYAESDRRRYHVPCPHCGTFQPLTWSGVRWPEGEPAAAYYACNACGGIVEERDKPALLAAGEWRASAEGDGRTAGYHLSALYSPFETWGEIATDFLAARRDPVRLKAWTNLKLGDPYEDRDSEAVDPTGIMGRLEEWGDALPEAVSVITAGVDVQGDRLELEIVGWGIGEESWSVEYTVLFGDPAKPEVWQALDAELTRTFDHPQVGKMPVRAVAIDTGGHHTQTVYRYARDRAGRRVWPIKGMGGAGVPVWPKRPPKGAAAGKIGRPYVVGVDAAKEIVTARLRLTEHGPGFCHFPLGRDLDYFRQLASERIVRTWRRGVAIREWRKDPGVRNETLDCRVYAYAALQGLVAVGFRMQAEAEKIKAIPPNEPVTRSQSVKPRVIHSAWLNR